jgi:predicted nucleic acid-binding protein
MAAFVLDASVAVSWRFPGNPAEDTPYSRHVLAMLATDEAVVREIWAFEVANSIFVSFSKRGRITESQIQEYLERLRALPIRVQPDELWSNVGLESQFAKMAPDAIRRGVLDLAKRLSLPLATSDDHLKRVARAEGIRIV